MEFDNKNEFLIIDIKTIRVNIENHIQIIKNVLYIFNIGNNLLFIIVLNKKDFEIRFANQRIDIIQ